MRCLVHRARCIALDRCIVHAPILPPSRASWACATSFCPAILPAPSAMVSVADSVFSRVSPPQPAVSRRRLERRRQRQPPKNEGRPDRPRDFQCSEFNITATADPKKWVWRHMNCPPLGDMFMIRRAVRSARRDADVARARRGGDRIMQPIYPRRLLQCLSRASVGRTSQVMSLWVHP